MYGYRPPPVSDHDKFLRDDNFILFSLLKATTLDVWSDLHVCCMYYATLCIRNIFSDNMEKLDVFHNVTKRLHTINLLSESSDKS